MTAAASAGPLSSWRKWPAPAMVGWSWPRVPGTSARKRASAPLVMGSASLKAQRKGLSNVLSTSQARPVGVGGRVVGLGWARARGTGGPLPCRSRRGRGRRRRRPPRRDGDEVHPAATIRPTGSSGASWEKRCQAMKASPMSVSPVGSPVLAATTRRKRSGCSATRRKPDEAAPVLAHDGDARQVEFVEERGPHPFDVAGVGVVASVGRLVRAPEADQVGGHHPETGRRPGAGSCFR